MRTSMDRKKVILFSLVLFSFAFLAWQIYQLVSTDISAEPKNPTVNVVSQTGSPSATMQKATLQTAETASMNDSTPGSSKPASNSATQQAYLELMHKLEMVRMERRLFDEEAGIAAAKERIATLNHHTTELSGTNTSALAINAIPLTSEGNAPYQLTYLDQQNDHWSATILKNNRYQTAELGTTLADGFEVIAIDANGLTLQKGNVRERLSFSGLNALPPEQAISENAPQKKPAADSDTK